MNRLSHNDVHGWPGFYFGLAVRHPDGSRTVTVYGPDKREVADVEGRSWSELQDRAGFAIKTRIEDGDDFGQLPAKAMLEEHDQDALSEQARGHAATDPPVTAIEREQQRFERDQYGTVECSGPPRHDPADLLGWLKAHGLVTQRRDGSVIIREGGRAVLGALREISVRSYQ